MVEPWNSQDRHWLFIVYIYLRFSTLPNIEFSVQKNLHMVEINFTRFLLSILHGINLNLTTDIAQLYRKNFIFWESLSPLNT